MHMSDYEYGIRLRGSSYIKTPEDETFLFVTKKMEEVMNNGREFHGCLLFAETGIAVSENLKKNNRVVFSNRPQVEFAEFAERYSEKRNKKHGKGAFRTTEEGYVVGENVVIGRDSYIEPGVIIFHDVKIGDHARIAANTVIKEAVIGDDFVCGENVTIGSAAHAYTKDEDGNHVPFPSLGSVLIGDKVTIGANSNVDRGVCGITRIDNGVKLSSLVQIGHESHLFPNVKINGGVVIAGGAEIREDVVIGVNAAVKNGIIVEKDGMIGMCAAVMRDTHPDVMVIGNPGKEISKELL